MVLDISTIINNDGKSLEISESISFDKILFNGQDVVLNSPVSVSGRIRNIGGKLYFKVDAHTEYVSECARCLKEVVQTLDFEIEEVFAKTELENENDDVIILSSNEIDLKEIIEQALCCALPITCLCSDDCKGLCPVCGCNLNEDSCSCETDDIDPRLAALKDFLK